MPQREKQSTPMTQAAYARHRKVSRQAVAQAIRAGALGASLVQGPGGVQRIRDAAAADKEWRENTAHSGGNGATFLAARTRKELALAERLETENQARAGKLVDAAKIQREMVRVALLVRGRLLSLPHKLKSRRPHLSLEDVREADALIREALEELAADGAEKPSGGAP
jgi:phage terminase Nu1 subunit (DNA packaging protein)